MGRLAEPQGTGAAPYVNASGRPVSCYAATDEEAGAPPSPYPGRGNSEAGSVSQSSEPTCAPMYVHTHLRGLRCYHPSPDPPPHSPPPSLPASPPSYPTWCTKGSTWRRGKELAPNCSFAKLQLGWQEAESKDTLCRFSCPVPQPRYGEPEDKEAPGHA